MEEYCLKNEINLNMLVTNNDIYFYELIRGNMTIIINKRFQIIYVPSCDNIIDTNFIRESGVDIMDCFILYEAIKDRIINSMKDIQIIFNGCMICIKLQQDEQIIIHIKDIDKLHEEMNLFPMIFHQKLSQLKFVD
jgi:hypothetical protein